MNTIVLRSATPADAPVLLSIYGPYVEHTAITFEYDTPSVEEFADRIARVQTRFPYLIAQSGDEVVGYAYAAAFHARKAYSWCVEVTVYVREECKGQGIGKLLYSKLEEILQAQGVLNLYACIAMPQVEDEHLPRDSYTFHSHMGYRLVGTFDRCGYKFGRWYDMIWMEKRIGEHLPNQPPLRFPDRQ